MQTSNRLMIGACILLCPVVPVEAVQPQLYINLNTQDGAEHQHSGLEDELILGTHCICWPLSQAHAFNNWLMEEHGLVA